MKNDLWVASYTAELTKSILVLGELPTYIEQENMYEQIQEIKTKFIKRFGKKRANRLFEAIKFEVGNF